MKLGDWRPKAECLGEDTDFFFVDERSPRQPAMSVCARCEVRAQCLIEAIETNERWGIWGGMLTGERAKLKRSIQHLERDDARAILFEVAQSTPLHKWRSQ